MRKRTVPQIMAGYGIECVEHYGSYAAVRGEGERNPAWYIRPITDFRFTSTPLYTLVIGGETIFTRGRLETAIQKIREWKGATA